MRVRSSKLTGNSERATQWICRYSLLLLMLLLLLLLFSAIQLSLGGSSPYTIADQTNKNIPKRSKTTTQYKQYTTVYTSRPTHITKINTPWHTQFKFCIYAVFKKEKNNNEIKHLKRASSSSFGGWKRYQTKAEKEYCWAITQAAGRSSRGRLISGFS